MELGQEDSNGVKSLGKRSRRELWLWCHQIRYALWFLAWKGQIKLPNVHVMLPPDQLKNKKFCKFHNATSHSTNECRTFWQHIQRTIQQGRLKLDTPRKMKVDGNPFLGDQNIVDARLLKGKTKKLEQLIPRCKYRSMNIGKLKDVERIKMPKRGGVN